MDKQLSILSIVPSLTELLFDLGLDNSIVGRTKFCVHPAEKVKNLPVIGGTKDVDIQKIKLLNPDLIIASKEENVKEQVIALKKVSKVLVFDIKNLEDNYATIEKIGKLTSTEKRAQEIITLTKMNFTELHFKQSKSSFNSLYLIWRKPYMTVGKDTFIHAMMESAGFKNMFAHQTRYPVIQNLQTSYFEKCELVLLSSEPYPFSEKHINEIQKQLPKAKILLVNGEYFSWYGSRIARTPAYFQELLADLTKQNV